MACFFSKEIGIIICVCKFDPNNHTIFIFLNRYPFRHHLNCRSFMKVFNEKTDHELIHLFRDGNLDALETLVLRHKDKLYTSILFLVKDKYLAEDIFQDVFIRIIDTMRGGRPIDHIGH